MIQIKVAERSVTLRRVQCFRATTSEFRCRTYNLPSLHHHRRQINLIVNFRHLDVCCSQKTLAKPGFFCCPHKYPFNRDIFMWHYEGKEFTSAYINDHYGFVYLITEIATGRMYIGRKAFFSRKKLPPLKGKSRKRTKVTDSDWQTYYGSNTTLKELVATHGPDGVRREILHLCRSSSECSYFEAKAQFDHDVLLDPAYFNDWIMRRVSRKHVKTLRTINIPAINRQENEDHGPSTIC